MNVSDYWRFQGTEELTHGAVVEVKRRKRHASISVLRIEVLDLFGRLRVSKTPDKLAPQPYKIGDLSYMA
jgi:hypothetical protein